MRNETRESSTSIWSNGRLAFAFDTGLVIAVWLAAVALANPFGAFALNDDWSYARTVREFLDTGRFNPCGWTSMTLVTHTVWGALFCLLFGYSFTALKVSVIVFGALGLVGVCGICRALRLPRWALWMAAITVGFNPLYFVLSCTYMTDVTGTVLAVGAAWFFVCNIKETGPYSRAPALLVGTGLSVAAVLTRQVMLAVPIAFTCASLVCARRGRLAGHLARSFLPLLVCGLSYGVFMWWMRSRGLLSLEYSQHTELLWETVRTPELAFQRFAEAFQSLTAYMGWFLFPVMVVVFSLSPPRGRAGWAFFGAVAAVTLAILSVMAIYVNGNVMPWSTNVINRYGVGPVLLGSEPSIAGSWSFWLPQPVSQAFWWGVTIVGVAGGVLLVWWVASRFWPLLPRLLRGRPLTGGQAAFLFLILSAMAYLLPLTLTNPLDRHLLPCVLLLGLAVIPDLQGRAGAVGRKTKYLCWAVLLPLALATVVGAHDYFEINRVKWRAADQVMRTGVSAQRIDAGFEFNGYFKYTADTRGMGACPNRLFGTGYEDYVITSVLFPGYAIMSTYHTKCWLPGNRVKILVLYKGGVGRPGPFIRRVM